MPPLADPSDRAGRGGSGRGACRACGAALRESVIDLGEQPVGDVFPTAAELATERSWPLHAMVCTSCWLLQLSQFEGAAELLAAHTHASASYSTTILAHGRGWTEEMIDRCHLGPGSLVVETASNDGHLLANLVERGVGVLGIDHWGPNVERAARAGVTTVLGRLDVAVAEDLVAGGRRADVVVANHSLANEDGLAAWARAVALLLAPGGRVTVEFHHALGVVTGSQFDTFSHSHCTSMSMLALNALLSAHGLRVTDAEPLALHGGSVRVWAAHEAEDVPVSATVGRLLDAEREAGLDRLETYKGFGDTVERIRADLVGFLEDSAERGLSTCAYGASARGVTLLNSCGVDTTLLPWVADKDPDKQGRYLPGSHLPIHPPERILAERPDHVLILVWTLADEIARSLPQVRGWGGRFVVAMPKLEVLN